MVVKGDDEENVVGGVEVKSDDWGKLGIPDVCTLCMCV